MKRGIVFVLLIVSITITEQNNCEVTNKTFKAGEQFTYKIYYNWGALWMAAGEASFAVQLSNLNRRSVYHFTSLGTTYSKYDWFYKVRDKYESYADTSTLRPLRFIRETHEGGSYSYDDYVFSDRKNKIYAAAKRNDKPSKFDSIKINNCTNDVMTMIYYARCFDFSKCKPNDTLPITFVLDGAIYPSYLRYLGIEIIKDDNLGMVRCIKFKPKLISGTIFKGGEGMTVWITDDQNKVPIYVETPIIIGTVKAYLINTVGMRYKLNCQVH